MIEQQIVLALDICKVAHANNKIKYTCHAYTLSLYATLMTVNFVTLKCA